jgi:hypothetical protein
MKTLVKFYRNNEAMILIFGAVVFFYVGVADFMTWDGVVLVARTIYHHGAADIASPKTVYAAVRSHI